jgi:protein-disulfide isomerase
MLYRSRLTASVPVLLLAACQPATLEQQPPAAPIPRSQMPDRALGSSADPSSNAVVAAPQLLRVSIAGQPSLGSEAAAVVVVEFMDYECPYCRRFAKGTFAELRKRYVDTGQVRWVSRNLPLPAHPRARPAAIAARCADAQGRFWEMHDALLTDSGSMSDEELRAIARRIGLNELQFSECLRADDHADALKGDLAAARAARVRATPSFIVGRVDGDFVQGQMLVGDEGTAAFDAAIARHLD